MQAATHSLVAILQAGRPGAVQLVESVQEEAAGGMHVPEVVRPVDVSQWVFGGVPQSMGLQGAAHTPPTQAVLGALAQAVESVHGVGLCAMNCQKTMMQTTTTTRANPICCCFPDKYISYINSIISLAANHEPAGG